MQNISDSTWLAPFEQQILMKLLLESKAGLLAFDNKRNLPLKMGGTTDIYVNLRKMRSDPTAIRALAECYANPLRRLSVDRIVEVPEAVSPLAGVISTITDIPLVTVREEEKPGRVTRGRLIGDLKRGDRVAIVDDVITDGASKFSAIEALIEAGAEIVAIIVLVDRQQGWKQKLAEAGYDDIEVWAAMNLHQVRRYLIENGIMQRCDPGLEAKNPLIVALDGKPWEEILPLVDRLRPSGCILKANDLLTAGMNEVIRDLSVYGRVMADPKWHDIPNTVANYCRALSTTPPWAVTVHASGGSKMVRMVVDCLAETQTKVLAVTVLTSIDEKSCEEIYGRLPLEQVMRLAALAYGAGAKGFVCSAEEAKWLHELYPKAEIVVPGLKSPDKATQGDQSRTGSFAGALKDGATKLVGGRQFLNAPDPAAEVTRVLKDELNIEMK